MISFFSKNILFAEGIKKRQYDYRQGLVFLIYKIMVCIHKCKKKSFYKYEFIADLQAQGKEIDGRKYAFKRVFGNLPPPFFGYVLLKINICNLNFTALKVTNKLIRNINSMYSH